MKWLGWVITSLVLSGCETVVSQRENTRDNELLTLGRSVFLTYCAACHGTQLEGTDSGPPLIWNLYVPRHHSDRQFKKAIQEGVPQHHWSFGPMPAQRQLTEMEADAVVFYVRSTLRKHGIR